MKSCAHPPSPFLEPGRVLLGAPNYDPGLLESLKGDLGERTEPTLLQALARCRELAEAWGVEIDGWLPGGTCSLIQTGRRNGQEVVLRAPLLEWESTASLLALLAFSGHGGVSVFEWDQESGAALLPRLRPGTSLSEFTDSDEEAIDIFIELVRRLRHAEGQGPSMVSYLEELPGRVLPGALRPSLRQDAVSLLGRLVETAPPDRLLHGDLHHFNILLNGEEWVAIDPEGGSGDPAYEAAAFLRNPVESLLLEEDLDGLLRRRIIRLAKGLGDAEERIWGWAVVRTLLSASDTDAWGESWTRVSGALDRLGREFASPLLEHWGR